MKRNLRILLFISAIFLSSIACGFFPWGGQTTATPEKIGDLPTPTTTIEVGQAPLVEGDLVGLYERVNPGVVSIRVQRET